MSPPKPKNGKTVGTWDEIMDPNGDITLVVGEDQRKLRVARNILCLGSPVFAKMLAPGSHFMEAQATNLSDDGTKHIRLVEDELQPLTLVLRIMHHCTKDVPAELSLDLLTKVATLCDKYDLLGCIRQWTTSWCGSPMAKEDRRWLLIGFVFENTQAFREITKSLILNDRTSDWETFDIVTNLDGVPEWVMEQMRACREDTLRKLVGVITKLAKRLMARASNSLIICRVIDDTSLKRQVCDAATLGDLARYYPRETFSGYNIVNVPYDHVAESVTIYVQRLKDARCTGKQITFADKKSTRSHSMCQPSIRLLPEMLEIIERVKGLSLDPPFQIIVQKLAGNTITIQSFDSDTIWMIKTKIRMQTNISNNKQRLIHRGKQLENDHTLQYYKIAKDATVDLVVRLAGCECEYGEHEVWEQSAYEQQGGA